MCVLCCVHVYSVIIFIKSLPVSVYEFCVHCVIIQLVYLTSWFAQILHTAENEGFREGKDVSDTKVEFVSTPSCKVLMDVHTTTKQQSDLVIDEFKKSEIFDCLV